MLLGCGAAHAENSRVVRSLLELRDAPGTTTWDRGVAFHLLIAYDLDGSGRIDRRREVAAIPCEVWTTLDLELSRESTYPGLMLPYGFGDELIWMGHHLGFEQRVRRRAARAMVACGLSESGAPGPDPPNDKEQLIVTSMLGGMPDPGSPLWVQQAQALLLAAFDDDASGRVDTEAEVLGIGCPVWRQLDHSLQEGQGRGIVDAFGLGADTSWAGDRLGLSPEVAESVREVAVRCLR